jgi:hypothetical protein
VAQKENGQAQTPQAAKEDALEAAAADLIGRNAWEATVW